MHRASQLVAALLPQNHVGELHRPPLKFRVWDMNWPSEASLYSPFPSTRYILNFFPIPGELSHTLLHPPPFNPVSQASDGIDMPKTIHGGRSELLAKCPWAQAELPKHVPPIDNKVDLQKEMKKKERGARCSLEVSSGIPSFLSVPNTTLTRDISNTSIPDNSANGPGLGKMRCKIGCRRAAPPSPAPRLHP